MKLYELAAAYQIFGSGGVYYKPALYSRVTDNTGREVLKQDTTGTQALARDSAYVVNRMMLQVIQDPAGTGQHAKIPGIEVVGKTGTENDNKNLLFAGLTPEYVGIYRIGYDDGHTIPPYNTGNWQTLARVWNKVMTGTVYKDGTQNSIKVFPMDSEVVVRNFCSTTGLLATSNCPSTQVGYYRKSNMPAVCDATVHDYNTYWSTHGDHRIPYYHANGTLTEEITAPAS
ncbi:hypothetical protein FACS1894133_7540 [Clostridia bacterium]|nr:hypothetical protein FACS1894133_7540 [Clostridia bacterium]